MSGWPVACPAGAALISGAMHSSVMLDAAQYPVAPFSARRWWLVAALSVVVVAAAHLVDPYAWAHWRDPRVHDRDWGRLLRSMGYLPTWLIVAIGCWTADRPAPGWGWRGGLALSGPALGGLVAEVGKLLVRRLRPDLDTFGYAFRAYAEEPLSNRGMGIPSSHVLVAFAGAVALSRLFPRAWWLWYLLAAGCAATRVLAVGHYFSDVVAAAMLAWLVVDPLATWMLRRRAQAGARQTSPTGAPGATCRA
jgi:membrane-associated phospholipid phosphatase